MIKQLTGVFSLKHSIQLLIVTLGLSLSSPVLAQTPALPTCNSDAQSCFDQAVVKFNEYRENSIKNIIAKTEGYRLPSAPFALIHPNRKKFSALLIHGLNDSPYYLRDIAQILYDRGMNVITILLPGHGLTVEAMHTVKYEDWINETKWGLQLARMLGEEVVLGGFSTGGLLATLTAIENPDSRGLILFAPAFEIRGPVGTGNRMAGAACLSSEGEKESTVVESPIKYRLRSHNSVCQLEKLISHMHSVIGEGGFWSRTSTVMRALAEKVTVPTYMVMSTEDDRVSPTALLAFARSLMVPQKTLVYTPGDEEIKNFKGLEIASGITIGHSSTTLKSNEHNNQFNPHFNFVENSLVKFVEENLN